MFDNEARREAPVSLQFRQPCVFHDFCYRHGHATYGYSKSDCDVLLQEHAYRMCRQIYAQDPGEEVCRERARVVLLGVNLFGGENFAHGHKSTYFEFDPFPRRADDYVAARVADGRLWSFYIKGGWMRVASYASGAAQGAARVPFAAFKVALPPYVMGNRKGLDRFVWLTRRSLDNSGVYAFEIEASSPVAMVAMLDRRLREQERERTKCNLGEDEENNKLDNGFAKFEFDCNTSVSKPVALRCASGSKSLIVTAGHASLRDGYGENPRKTDEADCADSAHAFALSATKLRKPPFMRNTERFLNNEFLSGNFESASRLDLVALGRGFTDDSRDAGDFRREATVLVRSLKSDFQSQHVLALPEALEPVAPFTPDGADTQRLISVFAPGEGAGRGPVRIQEWDPAIAWQPVARSPIEPGLDREWLRQPAQVVMSPGGGDQLFFSRVVSASTNGTLEDPDFVPDRVSLEYRTYRRNGSGWRQVGNECAVVDLGAQIRTIGEAPVTRYLRPGQKEACASASGAGIMNTLKAVPRTYEEASESEKKSWGDIVQLRSCALLRREIASRWHRSQVVPGFFTRPKEQRGAELPERSPDAIFVFNGFIGYSAWLRSGQPPHQDWAYAVPCPAPS